MTVRPEPECLTVPDVAAVLGVSKSAVYRLLRAGELAELQPIRIGRQWRISRARLDRYLGVAS